MTTTLKAGRFYIRRSKTSDPAAASAAESLLFDNQDDGFGNQIFPTAAADPAVSKKPTVETAAALEAIAAEGLTGRQMRTAGRLALRHNLEAESDLDAVRLLREAGINPFDRTAMLELVAPAANLAQVAPEPADQAMAAVPGDKVQLPQKFKPISLPSTEKRAETSIMGEVMRMQRDIARRRRRRLALLGMRLFIFVLLPTIASGWYYYKVATPLYVTHTEFVIQQAGPAAASGFGNLFSGTALATSQDSIAVQGYLQSRDAMTRLEKDAGFSTHFKSPVMDPLQRLAADSSQEKSFRIYRKFVKVSYDQTEGIIKMDVVAADSAVAVDWSKLLISYAEGQVDQLTHRLREDQMMDARQAYDNAEKALSTAQFKVVDLQEKFNVISAEVEVSLVASQIGVLDGQLTQERLSLAQMEANASPNQARMDPVKRRIVVLEAQITDLRDKMTKSGSGSESLAKIQGELHVAQADLQTRQLILAQSLTAMETSRTEANRQVRYLSLSVSPSISDEAAYPLAFENTIVTLLIMTGIYLMLSMTVAILREQVSS